MKNIFDEIDKLQEEINSLRPLNKSLLVQIKKYYRIGLTYSSNALEGNSLTETETKIVLEEGITIGGKPLRDHLEAMGHSEAFDALYLLARKKEVTETDIKKLHRFFYHLIDDKNAGAYRKVKAYITGSKYPLPAPESITTLMQDLIGKIADLRANKHPVVVAALTHKEFVFIHPFIDGNGRVGRLLMNLILLQEGYNIALIPPIMRLDYVLALEKAHENDKDFVNLIARLVKESQKDYLRLFR